MADERRDLYETLSRYAIRNCIEYGLSVRNDDKGSRTEFHDGLKNLLLHGYTDSSKNRAVNYRFIYYYAGALVHAIAHRVKKRVTRK